MYWKKKIAIFYHILEDLQHFLMLSFSNIFEKMSEMALLEPDKHQKKQRHNFGINSPKSVEMVDRLDLYGL